MSSGRRWPFCLGLMMAILSSLMTPQDVVMYIGEFTKESGGRLNKKDGLTRYGNSHVKDKTS